MSSFQVADSGPRASSVERQRSACRRRSIAETQTPGTIVVEGRGTEQVKLTPASIGQVLNQVGGDLAALANQRVKAFE